MLCFYFTESYIKKDVQTSEATQDTNPTLDSSRLCRLNVLGPQTCIGWIHHTSKEDELVGTGFKRERKAEEVAQWVRAFTVQA